MDDNPNDSSFDSLISEKNPKETKKDYKGMKPLLKVTLADSDQQSKQKNISIEEFGGFGIEEIRVLKAQETDFYSSDAFEDHEEETRLKRKAPMGRSDTVQSGNTVGTKNSTLLQELDNIKIEDFDRFIESHASQLE